MATPKYVGRDCELSTTGVDPHGHPIDSWSVAKDILSHIDAAFEPFGQMAWTRTNGQQRYHGYASPYSMDCLRHWAPNAQCFYCDMSHCELCTASCLDPLNYAAQSVSVLLVVEAARKRAELMAEPGTMYKLSTSNVDVLDPAVSWGTHDNVAVSKDLWEDLFVDPGRPTRLGFVASAMAAAVAFFGGGYLLPVNDGSVVFSLSGRAHHLSKLSTLSTTEAYRRGLLNSRREAHGDDQERLHLICFDFTLINAALKCCFLQCLLVAAEEGFRRFNLYDPVRALRSWSWGLDVATGTLPACAELAEGGSVTLPAYVRKLATTFLEMCEAGLIGDNVAPRARDLLPRIVELTHYAEQGLWDRCASHLDWAAKLLCLLDTCQQQNIAFTDPAARLVDHDFGNTNPLTGHFWRLWEDGLVDPLIGMADARACLRDGPPESRDWGRGRILQKFYHEIADVNWSYVELRQSELRWRPRLKIELPTLDTLNRQAAQSLLDQARDVQHLEELLDNYTQQTDPLIDVQSQLSSVAESEGRSNVQRTVLRDE